MVRLINRNNAKYLVPFVYRLMKLQELFTYIKNINHPNLNSCVYSMWHANQFSVHGLPNRKHVNILISTSLDGDIVAVSPKKIIQAHPQKSRGPFCDDLFFLNHLFGSLQYN